MATRGFVRATVQPCAWARAMHGGHARRQRVQHCAGKYFSSNGPESLNCFASRRAFMQHLKKNSAGAWRVTMAPRQLRLEPIELDMAADKGAKRFRVDSTERRAHLRYNCPPERLPGAPPGPAVRTAGLA
eukprot:scaffold4136_cov101-Isochrysis_galbana.AAC.8